MSRLLFKFGHRYNLLPKNVPLAYTLYEQNSSMHLDMNYQDDSARLQVGSRFRLMYPTDLFDHYTPLSNVHLNQEDTVRLGSFAFITHGPRIHDPEILCVGASGGYFLPGGFLDLNSKGQTETLVQTAVREMKDEIGLDVLPHDVTELDFLYEYIVGHNISTFRNHNILGFCSLKMPTRVDESKFPAHAKWIPSSVLLNSAVPCTSSAKIIIRIFLHDYY